MTRKEINCEQALMRIFEFIDHELGEADHEAMRHHLATCKSCFSRAEFERRLKEKLGALREEQASLEMSKRIKGLIRGF